MASYRKKGIVVEAVQYDGSRESLLEVNHLMGRHPHGAANAHIHPRVIFIDTPEGTMKAEAGDWIIQGIAGEFYPCKPSVFEATYELVPLSGEAEEKE